LRGKPALVIRPEKIAFQLTPAEPLFGAKHDFDVNAKLGAEGTLEAHAEGKDLGDDGLWMRSLLRRVPESQWKDIVQRISYAAQLGATISNVQASPPEKIDEPFVLKYDYSLKDFSEGDKRRLTIPLSPYGLPELNDGDLNRKTPFWLGEIGERSYEARIGLPKGFSIDPPPSLTLHEDFADVQESSEVRDGVLITHRHMVLKAEAVNPDQLQKYRDFEKRIHDAHNSYVFLRNSGDVSANAGAGGPGRIADLMRQVLTDLPTSNDSKAVQAESEARQAVQRMDRSSAIKRLQEAVKIDPTFTRAWIELGSLLTVTPDKSSAIEAFRKAADVDPKQVLPLKILAYAYGMNRQLPESIAVWQRLQQIAADDPDITPSLGALLMSQKRYKEAVTLFESAAKAAPQNASFEASLGLAHLHLNETEEGMAAIHQAVELDSSADMLNNVAYEIAEANANLDDALAYSQRAVKEVEERSLKVESRRRPE
jgi:Flp pilus assembly protein TadD